MKILYQERQGVNEDFLHGYFASRGITTDQYSLINIDKVKLPTFDVDYYVAVGYDAYKYIADNKYMGFRTSPKWELIKMLKIIYLTDATRIVISERSKDELVKVLDDTLYGNLPLPATGLLEDHNIVLKDPDQIVATINMIMATYTPEELGGVDYETTGLYDTSFEENQNFRATGVSWSFRDTAWFFDFRFLGDKRDEVMSHYKLLCRKFQQNTYAFNSLFEVQTTLFEVDEYCEFCELRHFWVEDGFQAEWPTFKYVARYYLHVPDWDKDFEIMSEVFGELWALIDRHEDTNAWDCFLEFIRDRVRNHDQKTRLFTAVDLKLTEKDLITNEREKIHEEKTINDVQLILTQFTDEDMREFLELCLDPAWNYSPFGIIPSRFLGYYCNLDAFYCKESARVNIGRYSELCDEVYRVNQKYSNILHTTGIYKDVEKYNDQWRITGQVLTHNAYGLALHVLRKRVEFIEAGKQLSNQCYIGFPEYMTIASSTVDDKGKWSSKPEEYIQVPFKSLSTYAKSNPFYELWTYVADWKNPFNVARGAVTRLKEWIDSGKTFDWGKGWKPKWMDFDYEYWNIVKGYENIFKELQKLPSDALDWIVKGEFRKFTDKNGEPNWKILPIIYELGRNTQEMALDYHFRQVKDKGCGEFYEIKRVISPAGYYNIFGESIEPKYVGTISLPDNAPGFITDMIKGGWDLDNVYYYVKDLIGNRIYCQGYERNQDPNVMMELFGEYDINKAKANDPKYQYHSLIEEIDDWLFWKEKELTPESYRKISVVKGLDKVLRRIIKEYLGDIDKEAFGLTAELISNKQLIFDLQSIPEFKGISSHEQIPDKIHFQGKEWTLEDFQLYVLRTVLKLTAVDNYNNFINSFMKDYMDKHKFGIFIGQYGDIYDHYIKKTDVSGMNWIDKFVTEFNEMDYSKLDVISEKNLTRRNELSRVKLLIVNEFKNKVLTYNQMTQQLISNGVPDDELVNMISEYRNDIVLEFDKFRFMGIDNSAELQVLKYDTEAAAGALEVTLQLYPNDENDKDKVIKEWNEVLVNAYKMFQNVVSWDKLTPEVQQDLLQPYGSFINSLVTPVVEMYKKNTGIVPKDYTELIQMCLDNLTDIDKSWVVNEDLEITDWLVSHMYTVSYLSDRYGEDFTDHFVDYLDNFDFDMDHPLYPYKIMFHQRAFKKYNKIYTYLTGTLSQYDCKYSEYDFERFIGTRWAKPGEEVKATIMRVPWGCNVLQSKRWNGSFHTVPSKSESKGIAGSPEDCLLSYMDISACEPRSIAKMSGDEKMQWYFDNDVDMYIECAELFLGHKILDKGQKKYFRSIFKTILLLILYNGGAATTAAQTGLTQENAQKGIDIIKSKFPELIKYIDKKVDFCLEHDGLVDTVLGDVLWGTRGDKIKQTSQGIQFAQSPLKE